MATALLQQREQDVEPVLEKVKPDAYLRMLDAVLDVLEEDHGWEVALEALAAWHQRAPFSFHATMLRARGLIRAAWAARGGALASEVDGAAWPVFLARLENADHLLENATRLRPHHPEPLFMRLLTARGLQVDEDTQWQRFEALLVVAPLHYQGHVAMLENLKAKWGGSHGEMFRFARERAAAAPPGHALQSLPLHAHWEMRNLRYWQGDAKADLYFKKSEVAQEVLQAWLRSVGADRHVPDADSKSLFNLFAGVLFLCGHREQARVALAAMHGQCQDHPWCSMTQNTREEYNLGWVVDRVARSLGVTTRS